MKTGKSSWKKRGLFLGLALLLLLVGCKTGKQATIFGVRMEAADITPTGLTLLIGGETKDEISYGSAYRLDKVEGSQVKEVPTLFEDVCWTMEVYYVPSAGKAESKINWEALYGSLPKGSYRLVKEFTLARPQGETEKGEGFVSFEIP